MKLRCVVIDDEPLALELIAEYVSQFRALQLLKTFDDAVEGVSYLHENQVDLLFVDINMPDLTGLELVASLTKKPIIIFTTAHRKFAFEGFELQALDYLLKPIAPDRFARAVEKAIDFFEYKNVNRSDVTEYIFVYSEYRLVKIKVDEINYIESMDDYIKIYINDSPRPILSLLSLKGVLEKLPTKQFTRIHRSFIVPHAQVKSIQNKKVFLASGKELPIGNSYSQFVEEWKK